VSAKEFGIYVTLGFGLWTYINAMVVDACTAYMHSRPWILGTSTPYPVFLLQAVFRNWLISDDPVGHGAGDVLETTPWTTVPCPYSRRCWCTPCRRCGSRHPRALCARYRDLFHAVQTSMRLIFFATPILWIPATSGRLMLLAQLNPIFAFCRHRARPADVQRLPMTSWSVVLGIKCGRNSSRARVVYTATRAASRIGYDHMHLSADHLSIDFRCVDGTRPSVQATPGAPPLGENPHAARPFVRARDR
jgi:hypothetical protein